MTFEDWPPLIWKGPSFKSPPRAVVEWEMDVVTTQCFKAMIRMLARGCS